MSRVGKDLLVNTIRSVDHQNRVLEEKECWKTLKPEETRKHVLKDLPSRSPGSRRDKRSRSPNKMAEERERNRRWKEDLRRRKEINGDDQWDHKGFHELYPRHSRNSRVSIPRDESSSEFSSEGRNHRKQRHRSQSGQDKKHRQLKKTKKSK